MEHMLEHVLHTLEHTFSLDREDDDISEESRLLEDLGLETIELEELANELELVTSISIPEEDIEDWLTVGDIVCYLEGTINEPLDTLH